MAETIAAELPNLSKNSLGNRVLFASSIMEGRSATEVGPSTPAALEVKALAEEIFKLLKIKSAKEEVQENAEEGLETA